MATNRLIALALAALFCVSSAHAVTIPTVSVGNFGNPNDPTTGGLYGSVAYAYRIGKTEVTVGQYTAFLNAVADTDTYALYNTSMATNLSIAGISRVGLSGSYMYNVIGSPDHPVVYVSWGDAARFANWLHNGQPTGPQGAATTERGAYKLDGAVTRAALNMVSRNADARWFIPTENEWYKAAYHQPAGQGGDADDYWAYPMRTNSVPFSDQPPGSDAPNQSKTGNFYKDDGLANFYDDGYAVTGINKLTDAGAYTLSTSPYGTFDQGGNVFEWNETLIGSSTRGLRGGSFGDSTGSGYLLASSRNSDNPALEFSTVFGYLAFRVATVPEPSTLLLGAMAGLGLLWRRRGLVCASILAAAISVTFVDRAEADTFGSGANTFDIEFVSIGDPGNVADDLSANPDFAGSVDKAYRIGKYEISEQMIDKANTLGGLGITKNLRGPDKPATQVSWNEAARFINWLNISSGSTPAYKFALQPGDVGYAVNANILLWDPADAGYNPNNLYRNSRAKYFLPSVDEWYKAAYFDPNGGIYYGYPTGSDSVPDGIDFAGDTTFDAVFFDGGSNPQPNDITNVGVLSPYGTAGQGGNVYEWEETDFDLLNGPTLSSSARGVRGGIWIFNSGFLHTSSRLSVFPSNVGDNVGFRVASIPEPSTVLLLGFGSLAALWRKRTRNG